eukprot:gnl/MRDRNA2_/MRDRNA2_56984_c0_seq1.p2 gnl/MRDRNA2_/MRDRNA2_56984_c0~~gnl/MRDRNA2_/MRDRNA2_56984_c0_seq1.p2  ORF type:complete len:181 (+),score=21.11 gnl/MRDRNA2_/MRDRNA2_56984_c0_seq1:79-621(+)
MNCVATLQDSHLRCGLEKILQTHRAILVHCILYTSVRGADFIGIAAATCIAMEVILSTSHATNAAPRTMENTLLRPIIIPEVANLTEVATESLATSLAALRWELPQIALLTYNLFDPFAINLMGSLAHVFCLVVTMTAPESLATARRNNLAMSPVVSAPSGDGTAGGWCQCCRAPTRARA